MALGGAGASRVCKDAFPRLYLYPQSIFTESGLCWVSTSAFGKFSSKRETSFMGSKKLEKTLLSTQGNKERHACANYNWDCLKGVRTNAHA